MTPAAFLGYVAATLAGGALGTIVSYLIERRRDRREAREAYDSLADAISIAMARPLGPRPISRIVERGTTPGDAA